MPFSFCRDLDIVRNCTSPFIDDGFIAKYDQYDCAYEYIILFGGCPTGLFQGLRPPPNVRVFLPIIIQYKRRQCIQNILFMIIQNFMKNPTQHFIPFNGIPRPIFRTILWVTRRVFFQLI